MELIINKIKEYLKDRKKTKLTYDELIIILNSLEIKENQDKIIFDLEENGIMFAKNGYYQLYPENIKKGIIEKSKRGTLFIQESVDVRYHIDTDYLNGAFFNDLVLYKINENGLAEIVKILKRNSPNIVCEIKRTPNNKYSLEPKRIKGKLNLQIDEETLKKIGEGKYVIVKVNEKSVFSRFPATIVKEIPLNGELTESLTLIAYSNEFDPEFTNEALEEAEKIPQTVSQEEIDERKQNDFRNQIIFTIDGKDTKDIDDAISIRILPNGNYELGVHIANVSHYIKKDGPLFKDAKERSTSLYMLNTVIPMLPKSLSNGICSLNEGVDRLAKSVIMEIDSEGNVVSSRICDSVIKSKKKMNYDDVNKIIEQDIIPEGYEEFITPLKQMHALSKKLTAKRVNNGQMNFASTEIKIAIDEEGKPIDIKKREQLSAEKLIENFMLTANETVAGYIYYMDLPFVYRVHEGPNQYKLEEALNIIKTMGIQNININSTKPKMIKTLLEKIKDTENYPIISTLLLRSMSRAKYSNENIGHFALASETYTHYTSPIRRFPDLMVHYLLDYYNQIFLGNEPLNYDILDKIEAMLEEACIHSSTKERLADNAEFEADRQKTIELMKEYIGQSFEATIDMITSYEVSITTENGIQGTVKYEDIDGDMYEFRQSKYTLIGRTTKQKYKIGNRVKVTVKDVDDLTGKIYFTLDYNISRNTIIKNKVLEKVIDTNK